jgi:hypothetical protein
MAQYSVSLVPYPTEKSKNSTVEIMVYLNFLLIDERIRMKDRNAHKYYGFLRIRIRNFASCGNYPTSSSICKMHRHKPVQDIVVNKVTLVPTARYMLFRGGQQTLVSESG